MERATPVRNSHTATAGLLSWSETPQKTTSTSSSSVVHNHSHQPSNGVAKVLFGGQISEQEAESLNRRKHCSNYKLKEITGNKIFGADNEDNSMEPGLANLTSNNRTSVRIVQQAATGKSQISFGTDDGVSAKKPTSVPEVAKQRELSGTQEKESDSKARKLVSDAKCKELSGNDIFGPPTVTPPRSFAAARSLESRESKDMGEAAPRAIHTSVRISNPAGGQSNIMFGEEPVVKTSKKIHDQKFAELTGNNIFKGDSPPGSVEKPLSEAKLKEMSGSNIFADGKVKSREYFGGVRKPPGGGSTIALV